MFVGATSAEKTGTVTSFNPMPMPSRIRQATSWPHFCVAAEPMGANKLKMAARKMVPLRPMRWFIGSDNHPALYDCINSCYGSGQNFMTYNSAMEIYGVELINPIIHEFLSQVPSRLQFAQVPSATHLNLSVSGIPKASGKERLAPLEPMSGELDSNTSTGAPWTYQSDPILE
jgi:hypothetical protein